MGRRRALICTGLLLTAACQARDPGGTRAPPPPGSYRLDFGKVAVGSGREIALVVDNPGGREGLVRVTGIAQPFDGPQSGVGVLPGKARVSVPIRFRPTRTGKEAMRVRIVTPAGERVLFLAGEGTPPAIRCDPPQIDLGSIVAPGTAEATITCESELEEIEFLQLGPFRDPGDMAADLFSLPDGTALLLEPHASATARVLLDARRIGDVQVLLPIVDHLGAHYDVQLHASLVASLLEVEPREVDFGDVEPGRSVQRSVALRNRSQAPVALALDPEQQPSMPPFDIQLPDEIPADGVAVVWLTFRPEVYGPVQHAWHLYLDGNGVRPRLDLPVRGVGGGPQLACDEAVDFGPVALGVSYPRTLHCRDAGLNGGDLVLGSVQSSSREFALDPGPAVNPRRTAEGFDIDLLFTPLQDGDREAVLTVTSNGGNVTAKLSGEGVRYDGCSFSVIPPGGLDFGTVEPGRTVALEATVANHGTGPCLLRDLRGGAASSPVFGVTPIDMVEIAAGGQLVVPVTVSSRDEVGEVSGTLEFWISRTGASRQRVPLVAEVASGCLQFEPSLLELGRVPIGCRGMPGTAQVHNTCRTPVSVTALGLASTFSTSFELVGPPAVPFTVPANGYLPLRVAYRPAQARVERGGVRLQTSEGSEYILTVEGRGLGEAEPLERFANVRAVDVLVVTDDSAEMESLRQGASDLGTALAQALFDRGTDFHLGVTSTSLDRCRDPAVSVPDGRLLPLGGRRVLARVDEGFATAFGENLDVRTCSDESAGLEAALTALTPPLSTAADDLRHVEADDGNLGFLRTGTELAVVFLAATEDRSPEDVDAYTHDLLGLARPRITAHAIAPSTDSCRQGSGRYQKVAHDTGGFFEAICDEGWASADTAGALARAIAPDRLRYVLTGTPPDMNGDGKITEGAGEISVTVNGVPAPSVDTQGTRWTYAAGVLEFARERPPPPGAAVGVRYGVVCE